MTHLRQISKRTPAKAESLLVLHQKVALFAAFAEALGTLAESVSAWLGLRES
ncbi:MAG TPA: hypothetical protein PKI11_14275 [Candidatus Hydrogenedentes bacterium]|nr:hypothetical protein [Candidatus Hydrogenedentota bacterium]